MKTRKLVLIIADIILLAVLIGQCVLMSHDGSKTFKLKETPDEILIQNNGKDVVLKFENNKWVVGDGKYPTNDSAVDSILDSLEVIHCIDKVGSMSKAGAAERYELDDNKKIAVTALKEGEILRQFDIGKSGSTGSQNFITVDGGNDIYLATGGLRYDFDTSIEQLRSTIVWDFDEADINSVEVNKIVELSHDVSASDYDKSWNSGESFRIAKNGSGEELQWTVTNIDGNEFNEDFELDVEKAQSWFDSLGSLTTSMWYDESRDLESELGSKLVATVKIGHGNIYSIVDIYEIPVRNNSNGEGGENNPKYYGKSNETPYPFELSLYTMEKINKNPEDLAK